MKLLISFITGFATGFGLVYLITTRICDRLNESMEIDSCEDCPIYIERNGEDTCFHYKD